MLENSLEAFRRAAEVGADGVELDARLSADGALVVHHDPALADGRPIATTGLADMASSVATLGQALEVCAGLGVVNVELKASPLEPGFDPGHRIARDVAQAVAHRSDVVVSSFNLATLDVFRGLSPETPTGWLTMSGSDQHLAAVEARAHGHQAVHAPAGDVTEQLAGSVHGLGLRLVVWTVNEPTRMVELEALGVDVIITDQPALAREILG